MEEFNNFLISKKIDPHKFSNAEPERYQEFATLFSQVHVNSFVSQKLFHINNIRRKYQYVPETSTTKEGTDKTQEVKKTIIRPKIS